ncbi:SusD/RagB family nutrient-binding outer membrane lipoprotein [Altibacter sp.]|uniref:SusD/RagB family nutrient-binding outer membrane lipoprotein n=1 Tax=Altibacter sp. TaxID=2024823 RepID=UPI000C8F773F|nr:SusD/RagB family nutrient-binding outer membrane lipoprotein [Altibacter sp.]MAP55175.1 hypothetical protein [Altibacter sp.]
MKKYIHIKFIALLLMFLTVSCETIDTNLTEDPSNLGADEANIEFLFNASQLGFNSFFQGLQFNVATVTRMELMRNSPFYASQFDSDSFNGVWINAYANCLIETKQLKELAFALETEDINGNNIIAATQIMEAYVIVTLVDTFGDVPYSEALQGSDNFNPGRDEGSAIYADARELLLNSIQRIDAGGSVDLPSDIFYGGNMDNWKRLANSLLLKLAVSSRLNNSNAASQANQVIGGGNFISQNNQDFQFNYSDTADEPESRHPLFQSQYVGGAGIYMAAPFIRRMQGDPRFNYYFYLQNGEIFAREHGDAGPNVAADFPLITVHGLYPVGGKYNDGSTGATNAGQGAAGAGSSIIMTNAFTQFLIAEAQLMLNNNSGAALTAMENGIRASISKVMNFQSFAIPSGAPEPTQADVDAYVSDAIARFNAASGNEAKLDVIITEYYKSAWGNGIEIYNNFRRTSYPSDLAPSVVPNPGTFTNSMLYPAIYVNNNNNPDAVQKASVGEKVWWAEGTTFNLDF